MLPRSLVVRFRISIADNLPAKKITGLAKCSRTGIAEEHQIFRLQHNNVIFLVASDRYLSPRRANKTLNRYWHGTPLTLKTQRECGACPPSLGARPALRRPVPLDRRTLFHAEDGEDRAAFGGTASKPSCRAIVTVAG